MKKYLHLDQGYFFQPVALEITGAVGPDSMPFLKEFDHQIRAVMGEPQSFVFLMQRLSVAVQTGNAASLLSTLGFWILVIVGNNFLLLLSLFLLPVLFFCCLFSCILFCSLFCSIVIFLF